MFSSACVFEVIAIRNAIPLKARASNALEIELPLSASGFEMAPGMCTTINQKKIIMPSKAAIFLFLISKKIPAPAPISDVPVKYAQKV